MCWHFALSTEDFDIIQYYKERSNLDFYNNPWKILR